MSKNNSFSVTTAGRYSLALYELAKENNSVDEVEEQSISLLKLIDESKDFSSLIKDPTNSVNELQDVINMIANNYKLNSLLSKFLGFLISKRRFFYLRTILQDFVDTCSKKRGEVKAELISSKELSREQVNKIKDELQSLISEKIKELLASEIKNRNVKIIFQSIENLHEACPESKGDWYFTGNYPTPGGNRVVNTAFINFYEGNKKRAY